MLTKRQQKADHEAEKAGKHFIRWAKKQLPEDTTFDFYYVDEGDLGDNLPYWYLAVSVPLEAINFVTHIDDWVMEMAYRYGLMQQFEESGTGCGFGVRDVSFVQKNRIGKTND